MLHLTALLVAFVFATASVSAAPQPLSLTPTPAPEVEPGPCASKFRPIAEKGSELFQAEEYDLAIAEFKRGLELFPNSVAGTTDPVCLMDYLLYFKTSLLSAYLYKEDPQSHALAKEITVELLPIFSSSVASGFAERRIEFKQLAFHVAGNCEVTDTASAKFILRQLLALPAEAVDAMQEGHVGDAYLHYSLGQLLATEAKDPAAWQLSLKHAQQALSILDQASTSTWTDSAWATYSYCAALRAEAQYYQNHTEAAMDTLSQAQSLIKGRPSSEQKRLDYARLQAVQSALLLELGKFSQANELADDAAASLKQVSSAGEESAQELLTNIAYQKLDLFYFKGQKAEEEKAKERLRLQVAAAGLESDLLPWDMRWFRFVDAYDQAMAAATEGRKAEAVEALEKLKQDLRSQMIPEWLIETTDLQVFLMDCTLLQFGLSGEDKFRAELDQYYAWCTARPADMYVSSNRAAYLLLVKHDPSGIEQYKQSGFPLTVYCCDTWLSAIRAGRASSLAETEQQMVNRLKEFGVHDAVIEAIGRFEPS